MGRKKEKRRFLKTCFISIQGTEYLLDTVHFNALMWQSQILKDARYVNGKQEIWNIKFIWCLISIGNPGFTSFDFLTGQSGKLSGIITDKNALHTDYFPDDITGFLIPFRFRLFQQKFISLFQRKSWVHKMWLIRSGNRKKIGHNGRRNVRVMQCSKVYIKKFKI